MLTTKKGQFLLFPPPELNEYFILISPSDEIKKETKKLRNKLYKLIGKTTDNQFSTAHISLFKTNWEKDIHVVQKLRKCLEDVKSFSVELNDVAVFSHGLKKKTLYLKIENPKPILALYESLGDSFKLKKGFNPHLTIEQNILLEDFEKIQDDLSIFNYQNSWTCDRITILKKDKNKDKYKIVEEILLQPME